MANRQRTTNAAPVSESAVSVSEQEDSQQSQNIISDEITEEIDINVEKNLEGDETMIRKRKPKDSIRRG